MLKKLEGLSLKTRGDLAAVCSYLIGGCLEDGAERHLEMHRYRQGQGGQDKGQQPKIRICEIVIKEIGSKLLRRGIVKSPLLEILRVQLDEFLRNLSKLAPAPSKGLGFAT